MKLKNLEKQEIGDIGGTKSKCRNNAYDRASIFSKTFAWYVFGFLRKFYRKDFRLDDFDECSLRDDCDLLGDRIRTNWNKELERGREKASLMRVLLKTFWKRNLFNSFINIVIYGFIRLMTPIFLGRFIHHANRYREELIQIQHVSSNNSSDVFFKQTSNTLSLDWLDSLETIFKDLTPFNCVIMYASLLCVFILINSSLSHPHFMESFRMGMQTRVALTRLVYEKATRVSCSAVQRLTVGKIVNLIANDASRFDICFTAVYFVHGAPIHCVVTMILLYLYMGSASFGCLIMVLCYFPLQAIMANLLSRFRSASILLTDDRLRLMSEILPAMRVIKMYVWEKPFAKLVHLARKSEIAKIRNSMILRSINLAFYFISNKLMAFVCILIYLAHGNKLSAEVVFVSLSLIFQIRESMTFFFPTAISYFVESYISVRRIEKFLLESESTSHKSPKSILDKQLKGFDRKKFISLNGIHVSSEFGETSILNDITFDVVPGKLTVIIGPVGSGKSSILLSILGEMPLNKGTINIEGKVIYASQESWIFTGTVRENILFGKKFDSKRYWDVVKVAALKSDFEQLSQGDKTMVDDRGTSLSGGQRARISLARALYTDADCYLLDDPLSAVDAAVAKHLFEECIKEYLKKKVVILVTHQLQFVKSADQIIVLKNGGCLASGTYSSLLSKGVDFFKYTAAPENGSTSDGKILSEIEPHRSPSSSFSAPYRFRVDSFNSSLFRSRASSMISEMNVSIHEDVSILDGQQSQRRPSEVGEYQQSEEIQSSNKMSSWKIYWVYIRHGAGFFLLILFLLSNVLAQGLFTGSDYWLSAWTDYQENLHIKEQNPDYEFDRNPIIQEDDINNRLTYSGLILALFIMAIIRTTSFFIICMRSSVNLHNIIFRSLIRAPIVFFDKTPFGLIINRVSRDLGIIDDLLPPNSFEAIEILGNSLAVFILCATVNYFILIPFFVMAILLYFDVKFYVNTARSIKRLEASARSPLFNLMTSTLAGLPTIRSYNAQNMFIERFSRSQNVHSSSLFTFLSASRLFGISMEVMCMIYIYFLVVFLIWKIDIYTGSLIGLLISQSLSLVSTFNWGVRQMTEVETYMTSVERVIEFGQLDKEELENNVAIEPEKDWPQRGDIVYKNVSLQYSSLDEPVLHDLTFTIRGGEKIGIVGRTGAGKSSIITTLFRLTQPTGTIKIDGLDTADISLSNLRKNLSIIPQEPILFSGTVRYNLDPFNEKSDDKIWEAIDKVQLKTKVLTLPGRLEHFVSEGGSDFSVGQKQLICLARAVLRKNRVLVLDEATANVDPKTDSLIQNTIRTEFEKCTVLTIAHRLNTIIDYDRVLVLDQGQLKQFDTPFNLISEQSGIFFELFENLAPDQKEELRKTAQLSHECRK